MSVPTVVFDLDGTLVDTAPDLLDSLNHCLAGAGHEMAVPADLRRFVGHGGRAMIARALAARNAPLPDNELDDLFGIFLEHYAANIPGASSPYPGAIAAVERFMAAGFRTAICTNKYQHLSEALMLGLQLEKSFSAICGADRFAFRKPDPRHLTETILAAGGDRRSSIMVGDSGTDVETSKAAGIPVVAVDWGYTDVHVSTFLPDMVISHYDELTPEAARRLLAASARDGGDVRQAWRVSLPRPP